MHPLRTPPLLFALTLAACGGSDSGTETTPDATSAAAGTTAEVVTTSAATHAHDSDHHDAGTGHDTGTTAEDHAEHGSEEHGEHGGTTAGGTPAEDYCLCMLESCHDQYHGTWGEDHEQSEAMCLAAAEAVPSVGAPATSGDSIECRLHFCAMGHDVADACEAALGGDPCTD